MKDTTVTQPPNQHGQQHPEDGQPISPSSEGNQTGSPGVYVRTGAYKPQELDMLWAGSKHYSREERSPWMFAAIGIVVGIIVTAIVFMLFSAKPNIKTGKNEFLEPVVSETELAPKETVVDALPPKEEPVAAESVAAPVKPQPAKVTGKAQTYVVKNGDTLERIAKRYYGAGTPDYIKKIQRANRMSNPNRLRLGQKLIIPPKNY